jgi:hypothetical protein
VRTAGSLSIWPFVDFNHLILAGGLSMQRCITALFICALLSLSHLAFGQASVNENLETAFIYVDGAVGSDSNSGTQSKPLKTIGAAASMAQSNNQAGIGSRVIINPGTYRESISLKHNNKDTSLPMTFQAATNGTVTISGGKLYTGWATYQGNSNIYTNGWLNDWGKCPQLSTCPFQQEIMMRREMVAVNGTALTQVLSLGQMTFPGTLYVDEKGAQIYVWPPSGTNMGTATVDVASNDRLFLIQNKNNIVVRGITFQYSNACRWNAAVEVMGTSSNILFDSDTFQWNNGQGFSISNPVTKFTVENSVSQHNGDSGIQQAQTKNGLWQNVTTSYNNWRGAQAGYYACNTSGLHAWGVHDDTLDGFTVAFNQTYGVHWDTDNQNISTSGVNASNNFLSAIFLEKDEGPFTFSNGYICNHTSAQNVGGLVLRNSEDVSVTNSVLMNNAPSQIIVIGQQGGISVKNWETGVSKNLITQNFTNTSNTIQGNNSGQVLFKDSYLTGSDWNSFENTLSSSNNTWWNASNSTTEFVVASPKAGTQESFSGWKSTTGQDSNSSFKAPPSGTGAACNITPAKADYWLTIDNAALTVKAGGKATYNLAVTPLNFSGTATLTVSGISGVKGLTSSFSTASIKTSGTSALTVTAGSTTPKGTYSITVIANSGNMTRTVTTQLTVN